jgi:UDP-2,4-diacetamido-2,4,6-trideoxy-beta-L-altropyranose hydrolase
LVRFGESCQVKVAIRTDASLRIGTGHVMRCLTLADRMAGRGATVTFVCRKETGHLCDYIEEAGFAVATLPSVGDLSNGVRWKQDAEESLAALSHLDFAPELLVVDQYMLDERWECALRSGARRILVIDDLADRMHDCDILLDPNLHDSPDSRYAGLVGKSARVFVGPKYALLRPEFERAAPRTRDGGVGCLFIFFGGADPSNEALKLVYALRALAARAPRTVMVLGPINPHADEIRRSAAGLAGVELIGATREMARLMADADLAVGTCGGAAWERCILGLPALVVVSAGNQRDDARILHSIGAVRNLGAAGDTSVDSWVAAITAIQDDPAALAAMSRSARAVMRGHEEAMRDFESALVH